MTWGLPSSRMMKSFLVRVSRSLPDLSRAVTLTMTRFVLDLKVAGASWAPRGVDMARSTQVRRPVLRGRRELETEADIGLYGPHGGCGQRDAVVGSVDDRPDARKIHVV